MNQPQPLNNQPVEVNKDIFEEEDGFKTPPSSPQPAKLSAAMGPWRRCSRTGSRACSRGTSPGRSLGYDLANVRHELRTTQFQEARRMQDLNTDEQAFFQKTSYGNVNPERPVLQEQGQTSRSNLKGLGMFLQKPKKK